MQQPLTELLFIAVGSGRSFPRRRIEHNVGTSHELEWNNYTKYSGDKRCLKTIFALAMKMKDGSYCVNTPKLFHVQRRRWGLVFTSNFVHTSISTCNYFAPVPVDWPVLRL